MLLRNVAHDGYYKNLYLNFLAWIGRFHVVDVETLFVHESKGLYYQPELLET